MFNNSNIFSINNLIDENTFKIINNQISNIFDFQLLLVSPEGDIIGKPINPTPFNSFLMCSKELKTLFKKKFLHLKQNLSSDDCVLFSFPYLHTKAYVSPIILNDILLGAVVVGEFKDENIPNDFSCKLLKLSKEINISKELIFHSFSKIPLSSKLDIRTLKECSQFISNYFLQIISNNFKSMELLRLEQEKIKYINKIKNVKPVNTNNQNNSCFLFNTLNSISRMAFLENANQTEEMIYCLSDLIRYKEKQQQFFPTIETEIDAIKKYLFIQNIRYKDCIKYCIDIPKDILNYRIPPMIIHNIIESSISYNIDTKLEKKFIHIKGEYSKNNIKIKIKYNNSNICNENLLMLLSCNISSNNPFEKELINCHKRLISYFGSEYGIQILTSKNNETLIQFKIPCLEEISFNKMHERIEVNAYPYDC